VLRDNPPQRMMMPREIMLRLPEHLRPARVGEWRWFNVDAAPEPVPGEERVTWLSSDDDEGKAAIDRLLGEAFPDASTRTADEQVKAWFGVYGEDGVTPIGCGAVSGPAPDVPFLASVTVHPSARRQGLASAMTAWVTRTLLASGHPFVSLGSMEGEDATHRLYRRLGYRDTHALMSGSLETVAA
ncbi:MAG TPA: GNAT family N-acetyltransferase, partial [Phytomonospora sp.]